MKHIRLLLFFMASLFLSSTINASVVESLNFLIEQRNVVQTFEAVNINHIRYLKKCLHNERGEYIQKYLSIEGKLLERSFECKRMLEGFLYTRVKENYSKAKIALALSSPSIREDNQFFSETIPGDQAMKIGLPAEHPSIIGLMDIRDEMKQISAFSKKEINSALATYNQKSSEFCQKFFIDFYTKNSRKLHLTSKEVCSYLLASSTSWKNDLSAEHKDHLLITQSNYFLWVKTSRIQFQNEKKKEYYELINKTPILLLLPSENPTTQEFYQALEVIEANALKRQQTLKNIENNKNLPHLISDFKVNALSDDEMEFLENELLHFVGHEYAIKIAATLLEGKNLKIPPQTIQSLIERLAKRNGRKMMLEVGGVIAANVACFIPIGKIVSLVKTAIFRSGCLLTMGLPVNLFFLTDSAITYHKELTKFLATTEGKYYWSKLESMDTNKRGVVLSSLFLPIGTSASEFKVLLQLFK